MWILPVAFVVILICLVLQRGGRGGVIPFPASNYFKNTPTNPHTSVPWCGKPAITT